MPTPGTTKSTGQKLRVLCATAASAGLIAGCMHDKPRPPTDVPAVLQAPAGEKLVRMLHATGVQIYLCKASARDPSRYIWVYQEPKADLSDRSGKDVGRHYAGPTWEADDGSKVVADVVARIDSPTPNGIQWLLLKAKSNTGKGIFAKVQSIQRLHTIGGLVPQDVCDASHVDQRTRVPYSADYYFYNGRR
jgi:hypothetical protein